MAEDCQCRAYCQNQRFQRKKYAPIEICKTEMKGFGLRAAEDIPKDTFIYEYVGDVVSQPSFLKRMRQYAEEGIRCCRRTRYFIDATKRGGIGRFANHSCNPNCYVAKWTVGNYVRMGIFANRPIKRHEELTFNYNVDCYGHDAQPCYCGEPNCVGFIGGKTQTDLAAMDDLYLDALGITKEVEMLGLKGSKKKGKKLDEAFIPDLKPIVLKDVPKVVQAMRQTQSRKVLVKLLMRIKLTEELAALRQIMRLRGFSVMANILEDYSNDIEVQTLAMECMSTWPLIQRNKVEDSKANVPVKACAESENEGLAELAKKLLAQWENLEYAYRIPKRVKGQETTDVAEPILSFVHDSDDERPSKRSRPEDDFPEFKLPSERRRPKSPKPKHDTLPVAFAPAPDPHAEALARRAAEAQRQKDVAAIIAAAAAKAAAEASQPKPVATSSSGRSMSDWERMERERERLARKKAKAKHKKLSQEEKEANKEKRLLKLIGAVVVKCMSKYKDEMDHDLFKKYAKELTHTIAEKEKSSSSYKEGRLETLSEEKTTKIKKFAKEYIAKVLRKLEKSGQRRKPSSNTASSSTPDANGGADDSIVSAATVADVMDLDHNDNDEDEDDHDPADEDDRGSGSGSPEAGGSGQTSPNVVSDPRIRHRASPSSATKDDESTWDANLPMPPTPTWGMNAVVPVCS
ncbi:hypothetical protein C8Q77DRAFT_1148962 [Trametes polyzona]|nr:hypothetical protein C8Q77DRAFT_1148962 [Trametes polyzona]